MGSKCSQGGKHQWEVTEYLLKALGRIRGLLPQIGDRIRPAVMAVHRDNKASCLKVTLCWRQKTVQAGEVVQLSRWRWLLFSKEPAQTTSSEETVKLCSGLSATPSSSLTVEIMCKVLSTVSQTCKCLVVRVSTQHYHRAQRVLSGCQGQQNNLQNDPGDLPPLRCPLGGWRVSLYSYFMDDTYWLVSSLLYCQNGDAAQAAGRAWPRWSNLQTEVADPTSVNLLAPCPGLSAFSQTGNRGRAKLQGFRWAFCSDKLPGMFLPGNSGSSSSFLDFNLCLCDIPTDLELTL